MKTNIPSAPPSHMEALHRRQLINRLRRVEGQIRGIQQMVDNGSDCTKIAQQLAAARKALDRSFFEMISCSLVATLDRSETLESARSESAIWAQMLSKFG